MLSIGTFAPLDQSLPFLPFFLLALLHLFILADLFQPFKVHSPQHNVGDERTRNETISKVAVDHALANLAVPDRRVASSPQSDLLMDKYFGERFLQIFFIVELLLFHCAAISYASWRVSHLGSTGLLRREVIGFFIALFGFALRAWARVTLGRLFTFIVSIRADHRLVTSGPYAYMLHPSYTGSLMQAMGYSLFLSSYVTATFLAVTFGTFLWYRVADEERVLEAEFSDVFTSRREKVARFIPYVF